MDRGIPTEETLEQMRTAQPPVHYLVGTPKGRLSKFERKFLNLPWQAVRPSVDVKLLAHDEELYILARSHPRTLKERSMRRRRLKILWRRLHELQRQTPTRDSLLLKLGAAKKEAGRAYHLVEIQDPRPEPARHPRILYLLPAPRQAAHRAPPRRPVSIALQPAQRRPRHLVAILHPPHRDRTSIQRAQNTTSRSARSIIRPTSASKAHIFIAFIAYCLHVTLKQRTRSCAPGLTPRAVLEKFATMQMVDVHLPTTDGRQLVLPRYTQPDSDHQLLFQQLKLNLPAQPPPRICV